MSLEIDDRKHLGTQADRRISFRGEWLLPVVLGLLLALSAAALVVVELGEPPPSAGFRGIALSNAVNSAGAREGLGMFRDRFDWLPYPGSGLVLAPAAYVRGLRLSVIAMALSQALALVAVMRRPPRAIWPWLIGPAMAAFVLLIYPPINTDVFSYASFGWVANTGENPYLTAPAAVPGDPFARMNDWTKISTPYGPVWTGISRLAVVIGRNDPFRVSMLLKAIAGGAVIALGLVTWALASRLTRRPELAASACILVAWSPIVLAESAGTAHNDALMMALALAGLFVATSHRPGSVRSGLLIITAAALIKPVALPLVALTALIRLTDRSSTVWTLFRQWATDLVAVLALTVLAFLPYWSGGQLPRAIWEQQRDLYLDRPLGVNPLWVWFWPRVGEFVGGEGAGHAVLRHAGTPSRIVASLLVVSGFLIATAPLHRRIPRLGFAVTASPLAIQAPAWAAVTIGLGLAPINAHAWYAIWPLAPLALVWSMATTTRQRWVIGGCFIWMVISFLVYHTWPSV